MSVEEITAWHEAGHAFIAVYLGGQIESISIDPDFDDGPNRFGDTTVRWVAGHSEPTLRDNAVMVALAGPVAEMIRSGDPFHPATVAEWTLDWQMAWQAAANVSDAKQRMRHLEKITVQLHHMMSQPNHWAAVGAIVDHLMAYEAMEGETVHEVLTEWQCW